MQEVWNLLNTGAGITLMAGILLWALNKVYSLKPTWQKFEGAIIAGIKFAEQKIDDNTTNKGLLKLDHALQYVIKVYEEATGKRATAKVKANLQEGIQLTHAKMDAAGEIKPKATTATPAAVPVAGTTTATPVPTAAPAIAAAPTQPTAVPPEGATP